MSILETRQHLENEHKRLTIELELIAGLESSGDRSLSPFNKKMEAASQLTDFEQRMVKIRNIKQQIADYEHALEKIEQGTYGVCDDCGKNITPERLNVMPQANLCLDCKAKKHRTLLRMAAR